MREHFYSISLCGSLIKRTAKTNAVKMLLLYISVMVLSAANGL